jgi:hypothetical protein
MKRKNKSAFSFSVIFFRLGDHDDDGKAGEGRVRQVDGRRHAADGRALQPVRRRKPEKVGSYV